MRYGLSDDCGVWVVVPQRDGPFFWERQAQELCNLWNFEDGVAEEDGTLKTSLTDLDERRWRWVHLKRQYCTCPKEFYTDPPAINCMEEEPELQLEKLSAALKEFGHWLSEFTREMQEVTKLLTSMIKKRKGVP